MSPFKFCAKNHVEQPPNITSCSSDPYPWVSSPSYSSRNLATISCSVIPGCPSPLSLSPWFDRAMDQKIINITTITTNVEIHIVVLSVVKSTCYPIPIICDFRTGNPETPERAIKARITEPLIFGFGIGGIHFNNSRSSVMPIILISKSLRALESFLVFKSLRLQDVGT